MPKSTAGFPGRFPLNILLDFPSFSFRLVTLRCVFAHSAFRAVRVLLTLVK